MTARSPLPDTVLPDVEPLPGGELDPSVEPPVAPPGAIRASIRIAGNVVSYLDWPGRGTGSEPAGAGVEPESAGVESERASLEPERASGSTGGEPRRDAGLLGTALLLHGLQSTALTMTRIADGLAAQGWRVIAPDLPGHGYTYAVDGSDAERPGPLDVSRLAILRHRLSRRHRLRSTAAIVAELAGRLGMERPALLGHSWGASVAATAASAGLLPSVLVLLDPPFVNAREARELGMRAMAEPTASYQTARDTLLGHRPDWHPIDLAAKAEAMTRVSTRTMVGVVATNVPFDPLPAVTRLRRDHPEIPVFVIVGELGHGSFVTQPGRDGLSALLGPEHVLTMDGAGHSPHRTHHEEFMALLLGALDSVAEAEQRGRPRPGEG